MNLVVRAANANVHTAMGGETTNISVTGATATGGSDTVAVPVKAANAGPNGTVTGARVRLAASRKAALPALVTTTATRIGPHGETHATKGEARPMGAETMAVGAGAVTVLGAAEATGTNTQTTGMLTPTTCRWVNPASKRVSQNRLRHHPALRLTQMRLQHHRLLLPRWKILPKTQRKFLCQRRA